MHRLSLWIVTAVLITLPLGVYCESDSEGGEAGLMITNDADYFLHVQIGGDSFPYLPPGETSGRLHGRG